MMTWPDAIRRSAGAAAEAPFDGEPGFVFLGEVCLEGVLDRVKEVRVCVSRA